MKINFSQKLFDFRTGKAMTREVNGNAAESLTLGFCCSEALIMPSQDKNADKKVSDLLLAMKVFAGEELEVTPEEASRLKEKIAEAYPSPIVSGQCCQMLNG
jgi:FKBP-type peptidyl-prolyl cis-trans isomerase (trigger factor)